MSAFAAFVTLAAAAQAPTPAPLFAAFKAVCFDVGQTDGFDRSALAAGWTEVTEAQADPRVVTIIAKGRDAVKREEPNATVFGQLFRHKFDGRDVWLAISRVSFKRDGKKAWANGCRAYDLDAPAAPARETLDAWAGKAPTSVQANGTAARRLWQPWQPGVSLEITYVPRGHPLGASYGIQGLIFVSQSTGGF